MCGDSFDFVVSMLKAPSQHARMVVHTIHTQRRVEGCYTHFYTSPYIPLGERIVLMRS
jgi:hypothetical protein